MGITQKYDVCIIGAGVAGGVMAAYLGKNGLKVAVVEKLMIEQERIIGELLQPGGVNQLNEMGLIHLLDGFDAQPVNGYAMFLGNESIQIDYPDTHFMNEGLGFRNGKFITSIRNYIKSLPNVNLIEGTVTELWEHAEMVIGLKYIPKNEETEQYIHANLTVVCDGPFSVFRNNLNKGEKKITSHFLGLILKHCNLPFEGHGHVLLTEPSPILCYPISSDETRMLIDFPGNEPPKKGEELNKIMLESILPQLPESIKPSFIEAVNEGKFKVMPNHLLVAEPVFKKGVVLIGDALNMRHPLTGGGMTVAFHDIHNLGKALLKTSDTNKIDKVHEVVKQFYENRNDRISTINILADALYGVMSTNELKTACFHYLKLGGQFSKEPLELLSAMSSDKVKLLKHFFSVAFYGVADNVIPNPTPSNVGGAIKMIKNAIEILNPLILNSKPDPITKSAAFVTDKALKVTNETIKVTEKVIKNL